MDEHIFDILANPIIISMLLIIGVQAILIELSHPGGWVIGFVGVLSLSTALYGMTLISVNWLGLGLVSISFIFFMLEAKTVSFGGMSIIGVLLMMSGLWVTFNWVDSVTAAVLTLPAAFFISILSGAIFVFVASKALQIRNAATSTGAEGLIGQHGVVRQTIKAKRDRAAYRGTVLAAGELWTAGADEEIDVGENVVITAVHGLSITVAKQRSELNGEV